MTKYEWKKSEKELYLPKAKPEIITVPKMRYFTIKGKGNPNNNEDFAKRVQVLYTLSYAIRMMPKKGFIPEGYYEYTVYPLEGIWSFDETTRKDGGSKDDLIYTLMIRQPDFVTEEVVTRAFSIADKKLKTSLLDEVKFECLEDGVCVQMMHVGSYDDESASFTLMGKYLEAEGYARSTDAHREIYISNPNETDNDNCKTVLRCFLKNK